MLPTIQHGFQYAPPRPCAPARGRPEATTNARHATFPARANNARSVGSDRSSTSFQGLTLVHFSAQAERFAWDRGCAEGLFKGCVGGVWGYERGFREYFLSETAQVELRSERV